MTVTVAVVSVMMMVTDWVCERLGVRRVGVRVVTVGIKC